MQVAASETLRIPLLSRGAVGKTVLMATAWLISAGLAFVQVRTDPGDWATYLAALLYLGIVTALGVVVIAAFGHCGRYLTLDAEGIWLERSHTRQGLAWSEVAGYETVKGNTMIVARNGVRMKLPSFFMLDYLENRQAIYRILDRHIGPDGDRPNLPRPADPISAQVYDYYGRVPQVEMEPEVVYRNGHRNKLRQLVRALRHVSIVTGIGSVLMLILILKLPFHWLLGVMLGLTAIQVPWFLFKAARISKRIEDRYVLREGKLYRIREGEEVQLPPPQVRSQGRFYSQPTTQYGKGPFAYEISMQFLEPDV